MSHSNVPSAVRVRAGDYHNTFKVTCTVNKIVFVHLRNSDFNRKYALIYKYVVPLLYRVIIRE